MAGTVTVTASNPTMDCMFQGEDNKIEVSWTCDASGDVSSTGIAPTYATAQHDFGAKPNKLKGFIRRIVTNPDDSDAPTDLYDIVLNDEDGIDVCGGNLGNRDTSNSEEVIFDPPVYVDSELYIVVSNAGNAKKGVVKIFMNDE